jgi:alpha-beta hydrolase superfamily lysophospholipase
MIGLAFAIAFGGVVFVFGLRWLELSMTFHPVPFSADEQQVPPGAENVWFNSADGTRLHGWFFRAGLKPELATIVYFHGNGGNISDVSWVGQWYAKRGFNVLLFDYRGYGASEGNAGAESGLYADGDAAVAFVVDEKGVSPRKLVLHGQSLGTAVVADVASRREVGAVILESGFSSASSVASSALPWLPRWFHVLARKTR